MSTQPNNTTVVDPETKPSQDLASTNPFGSVWTSPRIFGVDGEERLFQKLLRLLPAVGMNLVKDTTYVTNIITAHPRKTLDHRVAIKRLFISPRTIRERSLSFVEDVNNPGIEKVLQSKVWKKHKGAFLLFLSPIELTSSARINEMQHFARVLHEWITAGEFDSPVGILLNTVIPTMHQKDQSFDVSREVTRWLNILGELNIPIFLRFEVTTDAPLAATVCAHESCHGISVASSIRWGCCPSDADREGIPWDDIFGKGYCLRSMTSEFFRGGYGQTYYSGRYVTPLVQRWVKEFKAYTNPWLPKYHPQHINAGGVMTVQDTVSMYLAGAQSITIAPAAQISPGNMKTVISQAKGLFAGPWM